MNWTNAAEILDDHPWVKVAMHNALNIETDRPGFRSLDLCLRFWVRKAVAYMAVKPWGSRLLEFRGAEMECDLKHGSEHLELFYDAGAYVIFGPEKPNEYWHWDFLYSSKDTVRTIIGNVLEKRADAEIKGV